MDLDSQNTKEEAVNNLNDYAEAVEYNAREHVNTIFFNKGNEHAIIVFKTIFQNANEYILIVAKNLNNEVTNSPDYLESMKTFLSKKKTRLDILVSEVSRANNRLFDLLKDFPSQVSVKCTEGRTFTNEKNETIHFCVADGRMYRKETDTNGRKASCNFNDPITSSKLKNDFMAVYNKIGAIVNL